MAANAKEGLAKKLKDAETRADVLNEQISDLQASLERQRATADSRLDSFVSAAYPFQNPFRVQLT